MYFCTEKEDGGKADMLVSVAQVLSALELELVTGGDTRGGGVQMIRVDPMMSLRNRGVLGSNVLLHFS